MTWACQESDSVRLDCTHQRCTNSLACASAPARSCRRSSRIPAASDPLLNLSYNAANSRRLIAAPAPDICKRHPQGVLIPTTTDQLGGDTRTGKERGSPVRISLSRYRWHRGAADALGPTARRRGSWREGWPPSAGSPHAEAPPDARRDADADEEPEAAPIDAQPAWAPWSAPRRECERPSPSRALRDRAARPDGDRSREGPGR